MGDLEKWKSMEGKTSSVIVVSSLDKTANYGYWLMEWEIILRLLL